MTIQQTTPSPALAAPNEATQRRRSAGPWFTRRRILLPLALLAVVVVVAAVNGVGQTRTAPKAPQAAVLTGDIGSKVQDGTFEFVVTGVEHPGKSFAGKYGKVLTATGEFVIVRVDVTNLGVTEQRLNSQSQFLLNDVGRKFKPSADILNTKDALKYVQLISPGSTVHGASMLFDVAPGTMIIKIELHATPTSPGVKVNLL